MKSETQSKSRILKKRTVVMLMMTLLILVTSNAARAEIFVSKFGSTGSGPGELLAPKGVAVDAAGNIYVADRDNLRVQKFDPNGNLLKQVGGLEPEYVAVDRDNNIYVTDPVNRFVRKFNSDLNLLLQIDPPCLPGLGSCIDPDGPGPRPFVWRPDGVAVDSQNNVWIVGVFHLQQFSSAGDFITELELGGIVGQSIVIDSDGHIIFFEKDNGTIEKYEQNGTHVARFGRSGCDMSTGFNCTDPDGGGPLERGDGQFGIGGPTGLAVDPWGNIYGADPLNGRVMKFSSTGQFLLKFGSRGAGDGQFSGNYSGMTADSNGYLYVTDTNNRVQIFAQGDTRAVISASGAGVVILTTNFGMFNSASAVAEGSLPSAGKPSNVAFPYAFFSWTVMGLPPGNGITMTLTHPASVATGAQYWKVAGGNWTNGTSSLTSDDGDNVLVLNLTDGGSSDVDGVVNGRISDLGGLAAVLSAPPEVPFSAFEADVKIKRGPKANDDDFQLTATLSLGAASDGINPVAEDVVLTLGDLTITIPAGSFTQDQRGRFRFDGLVGNIDIRARINPLGGNRYEIRMDADGMDLTGITNPVIISLTIGNDAGSTSVVSNLHKTLPSQ